VGDILGQTLPTWHGFQRVATRSSYST
jgi:hypothetical protein